MFPITRSRILAILFAILLAAVLERVFGASAYIYLPAGVLGYFFVRYIAWTINERQKLKQEMNDIVEKAKRHESLN
jgi:hypothetical protein